MTQNDVLIIGAGPSGLFAAAELARHGVKARLVERGLQPHREARATAIQPGTLEILESVGDHVHHSIVEVADAARQRREIRPAVVDPISAALVRNSRAMLDVDYWGSPLVVDHGGGGADANGPRPGRWYPDWTRFAGTKHRVLVFGEVGAVDSLATLARLKQRWGRLVEISDNPRVDRSRAGLAGDGVIMVRPDGHIGFRFPSVEAEAFAALDRHLGTNLIADAEGQAA